MKGIKLKVSRCALVRMVELHGVESADHRTHRDLKDKWNTLVHTERIPLNEGGNLEYCMVFRWRCYYVLYKH
ncbi:hypothetical protein DEO72_LG9g653 [Vigna unguiculata]|uniref:Uncharacterized protein n=1 Tax=Vigna unguiculata TaxID=3917 RepID=A0A4D6MX55_VIGUN|nr:hypothetical protein DEO72_LG9g653 [Vigna unguiculata]